MSNLESMQQLADRFMNDAQFREEMKQDPEGAAERSGYQLDEEDRQALRSMDWRGSDEELNERPGARQGTITSPSSGCRSRGAGDQRPRPFYVVAPGAA